jgi:hypothetical protein
MSTVIVNTINSSVAGTPPVFQAGGTQIGTLCRAWVNFNGTGTVAIRASFNVSSITDNGAGDYTVNFTNAMPDANFNLVATGSLTSGSATSAGATASNYGGTPSASNARIMTYATNGVNFFDALYISVSVFR